MKLFGRTSGYYLFWVGFVYFWTGMYLAFTHVAPTEYASLGFVLALSVPLWCPPVARYFNMESIMFNWFKKKDTGPTNVVPFPEPKLVPPMPKVEPPKEDPQPTIFYRIGVTDQNRIAFSMGHKEITMNKRGAQQMIDQLKVFMDQIDDEEEKK